MARTRSVDEPHLAMSECCIWSNRKDPGTREITLTPADRLSRPETVWVCPAHEPQFRAFHAYAERYEGWFLALFGLLVFGAFLSIPLGISEATTGRVIALCFGALMVVFPFATPQTVQMLGMRTSVLLVRVGGVALFGYGAFMLAASG